ncbi:EI24 domain-containing protein [Tenacibaculum sp. SG-28]|uniref:EI24 domain-containing protein n=1 Tax=Tenacibaculum sp. SG-28 TaxID=754426 RepID=UPI000CF3BE24|nr:EI24 domain-containing protein [Tenacibaculum sp. SG-28]PQJ19944.1 coproporphyrinogen III oxidase [Tenacibaculum sp. SG-28]
MIAQLLESFKAYLSGFHLLTRLKLWRYFLVPIAISFLTAVVILITAFVFADDIGAYIGELWKWDFGKSTFSAVSSFFSGAVIIVIGLILYKHIVMAIVSPFMGPVSEKIEAHLLGGKASVSDSSFSKLLLRGIRLNLRNLFRELLLTLPLLLLSLVPVLGIIFTFIIFLIQSYFAGFGNMDYTLERHYSYRDSIRFVQNNKGLALGNGIVFLFILLIPVFGFILVLPLSVAAASVQTIRKNQSLALKE